MKHWVDWQLEFKIIQGGSLTKINHCKENSIRKIFPEIQNTNFENRNYVSDAKFGVGILVQIIRP